MQMEFRIQNTDLAEVLTGYIERRLRFALRRFGDRVGQVSVRISGNASSENECRISTELRPFGRVAVQESDRNLLPPLIAPPDAWGDCLGANSSASVRHEWATSRSGSRRNNACRSLSRLTPRLTKGDETLRLNSWERLHSLERSHWKDHTFRVVLATIAGIAVLGGLVMILPFG